MCYQQPNGQWFCTWAAAGDAPHAVETASDGWPHWPLNAQQICASNVRCPPLRSHSLIDHIGAARRIVPVANRRVVLSAATNHYAFTPRVPPFLLAARHLQAPWLSTRIPKRRTRIEFTLAQKLQFTLAQSLNFRFWLTFIFFILITPNLVIYKSSHFEHDE